MCSEYRGQVVSSVRSEINGKDSWQGNQLRSNRFIDILNQLWICIFQSRAQLDGPVRGRTW